MAALAAVITMLVAGCGTSAGLSAQPITLAQLENLSVSFGDGHVVRLHDGHAQIGYGGASADRYSLAGFFADGRMDGEPAAVTILVNQSAGSGIFYYVLAARSTPQGVVALKPFLIGDRVPVQRLALNGGRVRVQFLDRNHHAALTQVTRQVRLALARDGRHLRVVDRHSTPLRKVPLPKVASSARRLSTPIGVASGTVRYGEVRSFEVEASKGQLVEADLSAPLGLFLSVHRDTTYLTKSDDRLDSFIGTVPASGRWRIDVIGLNGSPSAFQLTVKLSRPPREVPVPVPTHAARPPSAPAAQSGKVAYLTFDDGPSADYTSQVLALLDEYGAKATFFLVGSQMQQYPELVQAEVAAGHTVGNHTWGHENLAGASADVFAQVVGSTRKLLGADDSGCLRPPYGATDGFTAQYAAAMGYRLQLWDIDTQDWRRPGADAITREVLAKIHPGAVVLMHDAGGDRSQTVVALETILRTLSADGWRFEAPC